MKSKMMILAALFGLAILVAPTVASAHPMPAWRRAFAAQRFQTMGPKGRYNFMRNHPYLARHRWLLNNGYANRNGWVGAQPYPYGPGGWGRRAGYMNEEPDGDEGGYQQPCPMPGYGGGDDNEGDDGGGYGGGYGQPMGGYGYGGPMYGGNYGMLGQMLPMLGNYIH